MCGIAGLFGYRSSSNASLERVAVGMTDRLRHRGPDAGGVWSDATAGLALGHRRLAIVDLTDTGRQPMQSASGRYVLVFNGEIYNFQELRRDLQERGIRF